MIIVGNEELTKKIGEFTASIIPVQDVRKVSLPHPPSALLTTPIPLRNIPISLYSASPRGKVRLQEAGHPLIVERQIGWGNVYYWAFQPWMPPFENWQGMSSLLPPPSHKRSSWLDSWNPFPMESLKNGTYSQRV